MSHTVTKLFPGSKTKDVLVQQFVRKCSLVKLFVCNITISEFLHLIVITVFKTGQNFLSDEEVN